MDRRDAIQEIQFGQRRDCFYREHDSPNGLNIKTQSERSLKFLGEKTCGVLKKFVPLQK